MEEQPTSRDRRHHRLGRMPAGVLALALAMGSLNATATPEQEGLDSNPATPRAAQQPLPRSAWAEHSRAGREHLALGDLRNAEEAFLIALSVSDAYPPRKQRLATSLSNLERLASLYEASGDTVALARIGPHVVDAAARHHGGTDPVVIDHLMKLAGAHRNNGDLDRARVVLLDTLNTQSARDGASAYSLANIHSRLGSVAFEQDDLLSADASFARAQEIIEATRGPDDPAMISLLPLVARLRHQQERNEDAEQAYLRALELLGTNPESASTRAWNLYELADLYIAEGRDDDAELRLREAMQITSGIPIPTALQVGLLDSLGQILHRKGKYKEADLLFQEAKAFDPTGSNPNFDAVRAHHEELIQTGKLSPSPTPAPTPPPQAEPEPAGENETMNPESEKAPAEPEVLEDTNPAEPDEPTVASPSPETGDTVDQ